MGTEIFLSHSYDWVSLFWFKGLDDVVGKSLKNPIHADGPTNQMAASKIMLLPLQDKLWD